MNLATLKPLPFEKGCVFHGVAAPKVALHPLLKLVNLPVCDFPAAALTEYGAAKWLSGVE